MHFTCCILFLGNIFQYLQLELKRWTTLQTVNMHVQAHSSIQEGHTHSYPGLSPSCRHNFSIKRGAACRLRLAGTRHYKCSKIASHKFLHTATPDNFYNSLQTLKSTLSNAETNARTVQGTFVLMVAHIFTGCCRSVRQFWALFAQCFFYCV